MLPPKKGEKMATLIALPIILLFWGGIIRLSRSAHGKGPVVDLKEIRERREEQKFEARRSQEFKASGSEKSDALKRQQVFVYRNAQGFPLSSDNPDIALALQDRQDREKRNFPSGLQALEEFERSLEARGEHRLFIRSRCIPALGWIYDVYSSGKGEGHGVVVFSETDGSVARIDFDNGSSLSIPEPEGISDELLAGRFRTIVSDPEVINRVLDPACRRSRNIRGGASIPVNDFEGKPYEEHELEILCSVLAEMEDIESAEISEDGKRIVIFAATPEDDEAETPGGYTIPLEEEEFAGEV